MSNGRETKTWTLSAPATLMWRKSYAVFEGLYGPFGQSVTRGMVRSCENVADTVTGHEFLEFAAD